MQDNVHTMRPEMISSSISSAVHPYFGINVAILHPYSLNLPIGENTGLILFTSYIRENVDM